jgi:hypothetical protein
VRTHELGKGIFTKLFRYTNWAYHAAHLIRAPGNLIMTEKRHAVLRALWKIKRTKLLASPPPKKTRRARASELVASLKDMRRIVVGRDNGFAIAIDRTLAGMRQHGFDRPHAGTWKAHFRDWFYLFNMHQYVLEGYSLRDAALQIAAECGLPGKTLEAAAGTLLKKYRASYGRRG